jgi:hypothetical protein
MSNKRDDFFADVEASKRWDEVILRMASIPPQPHAMTPHLSEQEKES